VVVFKTTYFFTLYPYTCSWNEIKMTFLVGYFMKRKSSLSGERFGILLGGGGRGGEFSYTTAEIQ
jgi:hypothetical protein